MKLLFFLLATLILFGKEPHPIATINEWCNEEKALTEGRYFTFGTLASTSPNGHPHTRMIEVSRFDKNKGALFFTRKNTRKTKDFEINPQASLTIWLPRTERQITLEGVVEEISRTDAERSWNRMPRFTKLSFVAVDQKEKLGPKQPPFKKEKLPWINPCLKTFLCQKFLPGIA